MATTQYIFLVFHTAQVGKEHSSITQSSHHIQHMPIRY